MVGELDITDQDVTSIADMIDGEINNLVPGWKEGGLGMEETVEHGCNYVSINDLASTNIDHHGCGEMHGRFEEFSNYHESPDKSDSRRESTREIHCDETVQEMLDRLAIDNDEKIITVDGPSESSYHRKSSSPIHPENGMRQELRWMKAKYQMQLREMKDQGLLSSLKSLPPKPFPSEKLENRCGNSLYNDEFGSESFSPNHRMATTAKSFYTSSLLPHRLPRASSLPVDAVNL